MFFLNWFKINIAKFKIIDILEANIGGPEMYSYELQTDEYIAQDKGLCNAYDQLQQVLLNLFCFLLQFNYIL